ncbi:agglutinin biogenesis protein MshI [Alteromonas sp. V450]|nr:agglutinin biogenesis protein MshI [Alteromonas sp. V450]
MPLSLFASRRTTPLLTVGISVSSSELHIVALEKSDGDTLLNAFSSEPRNDRIPLAEQIIQSLEPFSRTKAQVSIVLPHDMYHMVQVDKPELPEEDIATALPWTLGDLVPYDSGNMIADYIDNPVKSRAGKSKIDVFAAEKAPLFAITKPISRSKQTTLTHIHTKEVMAVTFAPKDDYARLLIIQEPGCDPFLAIVRSGALWLARRLRGLVQKSSTSTDVSQLSDTLGLEIQRSMDFYESQLKQPPLKEILFTTQFDCEPVIERLKPFQPAAMKAFQPMLPFAEVVSSNSYFALASAISAMDDAK